MTRYLSLFSGIEAVSMAWHPLGFEPVAFSEIEPFPCAVLEYHYPHVPNLGDITKITLDDIKALGHIDIVVGGSPCQAFSIAGLRDGLNDPRGNLMLEFMRIVKLAMPRFVVWENVPGVLSDKTGAFELLLNGMGELGYNIDTQVLDAQEFGLAQRRQRVFLICEKQSHGQNKTCNISPTTTLENLGKILLITLGELSGLSQNTQKDSILHGVSLSILPKMMTQLGAPLEMLKDLTTWIGFWSPLLLNLEEALEASACEHENLESHLETNRGLKISTQEMVGIMSAPMGRDQCDIALLLKKCLAEVWGVMNAYTTSTLTSEMIGLKTYLFVETVANIAKCMSTLNKLPVNLFAEDSLFLTAIEESMKYATKKNVKFFIKSFYTDKRINNTSRSSPDEIDGNFRDWASRPPILIERHSLRGNIAPSRETGEGVAVDVASSIDKCYSLQHAQIGRKESAGPQGKGWQEDVAFTQDSRTSADAIAYRTNAAGQVNPQGDVAAALNTFTDPTAQFLHQQMQVRRLTPVECARLQGFPDNYLDIQFKGKPAADGHKYKALGNSMAVPVMRWIGGMINKSLIT